MATLDELIRWADVPAAVANKWIKAGIIGTADPESGDPFAFEDVMAAAILARLREQRLSNGEITWIAKFIHDTVAQGRRAKVDRGQLSKVLYHATLRIACEQGRFKEVTQARGADPYLRLFETYEGYTKWLSANGSLPEEDVLAAARSVDAGDWYFLKHYVELFDPSYIQDTRCIPMWDITLLAGEPRVSSRYDNTELPWDEINETEFPCFVSISLPLLARQIHARSNLRPRTSVN